MPGRTVDNGGSERVQRVRSQCAPEEGHRGRVIGERLDVELEVAPGVRVAAIAQAESLAVEAQHPAAFEAGALARDGAPERVEGRAPRPDEQGNGDGPRHRVGGQQHVAAGFSRTGVMTCAPRPAHTARTGHQSVSGLARREAEHADQRRGAEIEHRSQRRRGAQARGIAAPPGPDAPPGMIPGPLAQAAGERGPEQMLRVVVGDERSADTFNHDVRKSRSTG